MAEDAVWPFTTAELTATGQRAMLQGLKAIFDQLVVLTEEVRKANGTRN